MPFKGLRSKIRYVDHAIEDDTYHNRGKISTMDDFADTEGDKDKKKLHSCEVSNRTIDYHER